MCARSSGLITDGGNQCFSSVASGDQPKAVSSIRERNQLGSQELTY